MATVPDNTHSPASSEAASPIVLARNIAAHTKALLWVQAGGRCEFPGCNKYVFEHHVTGKKGNFSQLAHIYAFGEAGPRADASVPRQTLNDADNLMVLCHACHKLVDDHPLDFPVEKLKADKRRHEDRIHHLTGIHAELGTTILRFTAPIAGRVPVVPFDKLAEAVSPRYPRDRAGIVIDLTQRSDGGEQYVDGAAREVESKVAALTRRDLDGHVPGHISVFAVAPIPLLIRLGRALSDKQQIDLYQLHRDTNDWKWKDTGPEVGYQLMRKQVGSDPHRVALTLSLSGTIDRSALPSTIDETFDVYDLTVQSEIPSPLFLRQKENLIAFRRQYLIALRQIAADHPGLSELHLFPAVPAPVAVTCGHALLPKVDPTLFVYDADKEHGGFYLATRVN